MKLFTRTEEAEAHRAADREIGRDARRGRPDIDLQGWAERRGLEFRDGAPQAGYLRATCPWSSDLLFNVVRGRWSTGSWIVTCHECRIHRADPELSGHGERIHGTGGFASWAVAALAPIPLGRSGWIKVPTTTAAVRVPHLATVTGLHIARRSESPTGTDTLFGTWDSREITELGLLERWIVGIRRHTDRATVDRLLEGRIRQVLLQPQGPGFEIRIEYGQVILSQEGFLKCDEELDALVAMTDWLARAVGPICATTVAAPSLDVTLPEPAWLAQVRAAPGDAHVQWPTGARLELAVAVADERGLALEDPRSFHQAFPRLNLPGEAFAVFRGTLPGTSLRGRLLCCAERPMVLPDDFRRFLHDPGGRVGCDVAVLAANPAWPPTAPEGVLCGDIRVAIADGVLTAWRTRPNWQANGPSLDTFATDVAAVIARL